MPNSNVNFDENKVPHYELPSALVGIDGEKINCAQDWMGFQRKHIFKLLQDEMYGSIPGQPDEISFELMNCKGNALGDLGIRKEIRINCKMADSKTHSMDLLLYLPKNHTPPIATFLGLNFMGNHTVTDETDITISSVWRRQHPNSEIFRGVQKHRWQLEEVLKRGYASATIYYYDIFPDCPDGFKESIFSLFYSEKELLAEDKEFGAIGAWAWGLSRGMDCLEAEPGIDPKRVIVHGHSRLGKASLLAGAADERFAAVISNESGCGGAALTRRCFGESLESIQDRFPHWFRTSFRKYIDHEQDMPFDQHMLFGLLAPRPAYAASASEDLWADPKGEFLAIANAGEVYELFGSKGLNTKEMPPPGQAICNDLGYHIRTGEHDMQLEDWVLIFNFIDGHFKPFLN
jgi:hypothetical protein